jgi:chaperonin cofactor prefoldin
MKETLNSRVAVLETQVTSMDKKLDELRSDVKDMHDCLDNTRDSVLAQLGVMTAEYRTNAQQYYQHADKLNAQQSAQHAELASKISELEKIKSKYTTYALVALAFAAGTGWLNSVHLPHLLKFLGL